MKSPRSRTTSAQRQTGNRHTSYRGAELAKSRKAKEARLKANRKNSSLHPFHYSSLNTGLFSVDTSASKPNQSIRWPLLVRILVPIVAILTLAIFTYDYVLLFLESPTGALAILTDYGSAELCRMSEIKMSATVSSPFGSPSKKLLDAINARINSQLG